MIKDWEYSLILSCNHLTERITLNEIENKITIPTFEERYRSAKGQKAYCDECQKTRKVTGWQKELVNITYTTMKEFREVNYPADFWLDNIPMWQNI